MLENSILERIARGDQTAVADCMNRYGGLIWSLARQFCSYEEDAEDATQEIFMAIWKNADRFSSQKGSETTFVATIARRKLIDKYRAAKKSRETASTEEVMQKAGSVESRNVDTIDEATRVETFFQHLTPDQANTIQLSIYDGMSHSQISEKTGLSLGTVKTNIRRGLDRMRKLLRQKAK